MFSNFLSLQLGPNTGRDYVMAGVIFIGAWIILKILQVLIVSYLGRLSKKTKTDADDMIVRIVANVKPPLYFLIAIYLAVRSLTLPTLAVQIVKILFILVLVYEVIKALQDIIEYVARKAMVKSGQDEEVSKASIKTLSVLVKIVLWSLGLLLVLSNLGVNVTSLIAGLGIGGIAVALAIQNILADIFASFSILIDKPFEVGDFIIVGSDMGTVEKIGIKTSHIRTLDGQQLIISNKELTEARVQNFKRLEKRRALLNLGVIYETDREKLQKIPGMIKEIVSSVGETEFDRCHFKSFGDYSLNFEVAYYVLKQDYIEYLDVVEKVNLAIFEAFKNEKIEFAYPTNVQYTKKI